MEPKKIVITVTLGNDAIQTTDDVAELLQRMSRSFHESSWDDVPSWLNDINGNKAATIEIWE